MLPKFSPDEGDRLAAFFLFGMVAVATVTGLVLYSVPALISLFHSLFWR